MKLYTGKGDTGTTGILGKDRLSKDDSRIEAYGTVDELNSILGMVAQELSSALLDDLHQIQADLFEIGTELASENPKAGISQHDVQRLESLIDTATEDTPALTSFILPGGCQAASWLHMARTITRRTERRVVTLSRSINLNPVILVYLNRLSDLFFAWARWENHQHDVADIPWKARS